MGYSQRARLVGFFALVLGACGGGDSASAPSCPPTLGDPMVDHAKKLIELTVDEKSALCDWGVCNFGGYGAMASCTNGAAVIVAPNRQACVGQFPKNANCTATVQDQVDCVTATAKNPCQTTLFSSACSKVLACALLG
jgi:hypothetical protein